MSDKRIQPGKDGAGAPVTPAGKEIREVPGDGYPPGKDVSKPPPASDVRTGKHKKPEKDQAE